MTFEQLLVKYLYQHKKVSLQGFGTVTLNSNIPDAELIHKNRQIPIEGAVFEPNIKAHTDENFVIFFSQQRGKIRPLAESDIESHLQLAKQLMNIGKPYEVEGLGIFAMQKDGSVILQPGQYAVTFADNAGQPTRLRERTEQQEKTEREGSPATDSSDPAEPPADVKFDPATEKFIGNAAADKLLTREYRAGFVVPEKI